LVHAQGTASLSNDSAPYTHLEYGQQVTVKIRGAAPLSTVQAILNGGPLTTVGRTNAAGAFTVSAVEGGAESYPNFDSYEEYFYVGGTYVEPSNPTLPGYHSLRRFQILMFTQTIVPQTAPDNRKLFPLA
jgi:hypothetical protein